MEFSLAEVFGAKRAFYLAAAASETEVVDAKAVLIQVRKFVHFGKWLTNWLTAQSERPAVR